MVNELQSKQKSRLQCLSLRLLYVTQLKLIKGLVFPWTYTLCCKRKAELLNFYKVLLTNWITSHVFVAERKCKKCWTLSLRIWSRRWANNFTFSLIVVWLKFIKLLAHCLNIDRFIRRQKILKMELKFSKKKLNSIF